MGTGEIQGAGAKGRMVGVAVGGGREGRGWRAAGLCKEGSAMVVVVEGGGSPPESIPGRGPSSPPPLCCGMGHLQP